MAECVMRVIFRLGVALQIFQFAYVRQRRGAPIAIIARAPPFDVCSLGLGRVAPIAIVAHVSLLQLLLV